jgi:hypothetical protein
VTTSDATQPPTLVTGAITTSDEAVDAFLASIDWVALVLQSDQVAQHWEDPSVLAGMTVGMVAGHLFLATRVLARQLDQGPPPPDAITVSMPLAYRRSRVADPDDLDSPVYRVVRDDGAHVGAQGTAVVIARFDKLRHELRERLDDRDGTLPRAVLRQDGTAVSLSDFVVSRLIEVVVHGDDLMASVGLDTPAPPPSACALAIEFLVRGAREQAGDLAVLRELTRRERATTDALRAL